MAMEIKGGIVVNERGIMVTYRQKCEKCGYTYSERKTTICPAHSTRSCRDFTCPECGHHQEVFVRHYTDPQKQ